MHQGNFNNVIESKRRGIHLSIPKKTRTRFDRGRDLVNSWVYFQILPRPHPSKTTSFFTPARVEGKKESTGPREIKERRVVHIIKLYPLQSEKDNFDIVLSDWDFSYLAGKAQNLSNEERAEENPKSTERSSNLRASTYCTLIG